MDRKNLLAILGSPHTDKTTAAMLGIAVEEAEKRGFKVTRIHLYEKNIGYCKGCRACLATGVCVRKDDIQEIASLLRGCSVVILAAPVYWANVPAPVKNLFDRLLRTAMEETGTFPKPRLKDRKYMLLTCCNTPFPFSWIFGQSTGAVRSMDEFFRTAGMKPIGKIICPGAGNKRELPNSLIKKIRRRLQG